MNLYTVTFYNQELTEKKYSSKGSMNRCELSCGGRLTDSYEKAIEKTLAEPYMDGWKWSEFWGITHKDSVCIVRKHEGTQGWSKVIEMKTFKNAKIKELFNKTKVVESRFIKGEYGDTKSDCFLALKSTADKHETVFDGVVLKEGSYKECLEAYNEF